MGKKKETTTSVTQPTPTPEETELNRLALERTRAAQPGLLEVQRSGLDITNRLLSGQPLPSAYGDVYGGISPQLVDEIVAQSLRDITPGFQQSGLLDSGVRASISSRTAGDIRRQAAQFNVGSRYNLLSLALGGQGQVQQPVLGSEATVGGRLAGLRRTETMGTSKGMNPFLESFQRSLGQTLGSPSFSMGPFSFGGGR